MITRDLKISKMLKQYPQTLDILIKTSSHFNKLNNPFLRKSLASRVNIEQAARVAGVPLIDLLRRLNYAIGEGSQSIQPEEDKISMNNLKMNTKNHEIPDELPAGNIIELDVRPIIDSGRDPFKDIMGKAKILGENEVLMIINNFEPVPLYSVLGKKGFAHKTINSNGVWKIYFFKDNHSNVSNTGVETKNPEFNEEVFELDVRDLEPPEPMIRILETLPRLNDKTILVVYHHREPLMLYDKLVERGYNAITNKIKDNYYKIIITRSQKD